MTVGEIKNLVMFQTNNDAEDLGDFLPFLMGYINDGYDKVVYAWAEEHVDSGSELYSPLTEDSDIPAVPAWTHKAIADWATWLIYKNGNPARQNRGYIFKTSAEETVNKVTSEGGQGGRARHFINIPGLLNGQDIHYEYSPEE